MASSRNQFIFRLHLIGVTAAAVLALAGGGILLLACQGEALTLTHPAGWGTALLFFAGFCVLAFIGLSRMQVWRGPAYFAVGAVMWVAMYESGATPGSSR